MKQTLLSILISLGIMAQAQPSIFPDGVSFAQCPNTNIIYFIANLPPHCLVLDTIINGTLISYNPDLLPVQATIKWDEVQGYGQIIFKKSGHLHCKDTNKLVFDIPIISMKGLMPTIEGPDSVSFFDADLQRYKLRLHHHVYGISDQSELLGSSNFEWILPPKWDGFYMSTSNNLTVFEMDDLSGCIQARGDDKCNNQSAWATKCVTRYWGTPCPNERPIFDAFAGSTSIKYLNGSIPFNSGYQDDEFSFDWVIPKDWLVLTSSDKNRNLTIKPDGKTVGPLGYRTIYDKTSDTSAFCFYNIKVEPLGFFFNISGKADGLYCEGDKININDVPSGSTLSWRLIPNDIKGRFKKMEGNTETIVLEAETPGLNGDFRMEVIVSNSLGTSVVPYRFWFGPPRIRQATLNQEPYARQEICTGVHHLTAVSHEIGQCPKWELDSKIEIWESCADLSLVLPEPSPNCLTVKALYDNVCGTTAQVFELCKAKQCTENADFVLRINPNPASSVLRVRVENPNDPNDARAAMRKLELIDMSGKVFSAWDGTPAQDLLLAVPKVPAGIYIARATVWDKTYDQRILLMRRY